ncbi:ROK family glucokinase [Butyrivibrio sp. MC2013]|uniref:ROK family glucokinase n=1 Tax=Butyrivibrio sp. MC2013 TaxID=1280686 RepID=UPI00040A48A9|nr:ROK family glucokinase [Butyrivibrio sp. MC2013]
MRYAFGVDIGGTTVKLGLLTQDGNILDSWEIPTRTEDGGVNILPDIAASIRAKIAEKNLNDNDIAGVGVGAPGAVDDKGVVHQAVNLGWGRFSLKEELHAMVKLPVMAGNDANVAALGECWKGGGRGHKNMLMVTLGTGVGGGVIVNGKIVNGVTGSGGEIGHMHLVDGEEEACGCGNHGCFEQYASATGAVLLANRVLAASDKDSVLRHTEISAKNIFDAAKDGDELACEIAKQYGYYLGKGLALCASVLNPEVIVLGGGVSKCGSMLFDLLKPSFEEFVFKGCKDTPFALAELGNEAGICGAARMVIDP